MEDIKYLTGAAFRVWGERGSNRRFLQWQHPELNPPVTLLLEERDIAQLLQILRQELPPEAYSDPSPVQ